MNYILHSKLMRSKILKMLIIVVALICTNFQRLDAFAHFRDAIPNGRVVPHPCKANNIWYGVGHENSQGGGNRNYFGRDFNYFGKVWNECLCRQDSDGDGKTNGEELGDPNCIWYPGQIPERTTAITHPGVCDPFDDSRCEDNNDFLDCSTQDEFDCEATNEPDVKEMSFRLDETTVPAEETTYICQSFDLPSDGDYHVIAGKPIIDNINVMHHLLAFGCRDWQYTDEIRSLYTYPRAGCSDMVICTEPIFTWSLGTGAQCLDPNMGFRIGANGFTHVILQIHWNNPELVSSYRDSSGFTMYYTENLRPNDGGIFSVAPLYVQIPPGRVAYENIGSCSGECTSAILGEDKITITRIYPHMHYLGSRMVFHQIRNGNIVREVDIEKYYYDRPEVIDLDDPIEVYGGDILNVTCFFDSVGKEKFTFWGDATSDEMCIVGLIYYPLKPEVNFCAMSDGYGRCSFTINFDNVTDCDVQSFYDAVWYFQDGVGDKCDATGMQCFDGCEEEVAQVNNHTCLKTKAADALLSGNMYYYNSVKEDYGEEILSMLWSCDPKPDVEIPVETSSEVGDCSVIPSGADVKVMSSIVIALVLVYSLVISVVHTM